MSEDLSNELPPLLVQSLTDEAAAEQSPAKHPGGRPALYTDELAIKILTRIVEGESLSAICRDESMPSISTVLKWRRQDPEFAKHYDSARVDRADTHAEWMMDIADDGRNDWMQIHGKEDTGWRLNGEHVQRSRLRVDTLKWIASRMNPKKYGELIRQEHTGADGAPLAAPSFSISFPEGAPGEDGEGHGGGSDK